MKRLLPFIIILLVLGVAVVSAYYLKRSATDVHRLHPLPTEPGRRLPQSPLLQVRYQVLNPRIRWDQPMRPLTWRSLETLSVRRVDCYIQFSLRCTVSLATGSK
jgi:hypothetical protein